MKPVIIPATVDRRDIISDSLSEDSGFRIAHRRAFQKQSKQRPLLINDLHGQIGAFHKNCGNVLATAPNPALTNTGGGSRARKAAQHFRTRINDFITILLQLINALLGKSGQEAVIDALLTQKAGAHKYRVEKFFLSRHFIRTLLLHRYQPGLDNNPLRIFLQPRERPARRKALDQFHIREAAPRYQERIHNYNFAARWGHAT